MTRKFLEIATTPGVQQVQSENNSRQIWQDMITDGPNDHLGAGEAAFISKRNSFYMATVSETGWPYVQHRGGSVGFLKVISPSILAFADYSGNRQYLTTGNLRANDRAALIMVDYSRRRRLKIYAQIQILSAEEIPELTAAVIAEDTNPYERIMLLQVIAFDWNCPQYITPRFTESQVMEAANPLRSRIVELEAENDALRARLAANSGETDGK